MSMSITEIRSRVFSRLAAELASPTYTQIHSNTITTWADEATAIVTKKMVMLGDQAQFQSLIVLNAAIVLTAGIGSLPTDYETHITAKGIFDGTTRRVWKLYDDPALFARWDSSNYALTPVETKPIALIAGGSINFKPVSVDSGLLDYIQVHPTLASNNTEYGDLGDTMLIGIVVGRCFDFLEEPELAKAARAEVGL